MSQSRRLLSNFFVEGKKIENRNGFYIADYYIST